MKTLTETGAERNVPANIGTQAVVHIGDGVTLTRTGAEFDPALPFEQWEGIGKKLRQLEGAVLWWLGDWLNFGEHTYGQKYSQALEQTDYSYSTLTKASWVGKQFEFCSRLQNLPWSFHMEVAGQDPEVARVLLDTAEAEGWTQKELRAAVKEFTRNLSKDAGPLPAGTFNVVYTDPPWQYSNAGLGGSAESHYPTMATEDICAMEIPDHLADDAVLFLWVTNPLLKDGISVLEAWGFDYKTNFVWVKDRSCYGKLGFYNYGQHELLLVGTRGSFLPAQESLAPSLIESALREHSRKPDSVYELIETMYPDASRLELFARTERDGWTAWGNEVGKW